ncbi:MAG: Rieske (2Fe-2S) protein [Trebonia sp.]|jgi:Rieske Fe-S protein
MTEGAPTDHAADHGASRRAVLLCAGLAGAGGAAVLLTACSTAAVPYDANDAGQAPGPDLAVTSAPSAPSEAAANPPAAAGPASAAASPASGGISGTVLGQTADIPVGGGMVFTDAKVVVTQPTKGVFKGFSAVCTHVGCLCNQVADGTIDCPCHGAKFAVATGAVVAGPASSPLPSAPITVTDGKILLR